eukprot:4317935-Lingulodinium_polyedra.AAC.1
MRSSRSRRESCCGCGGADMGASVEETEVGCKGAAERGGVTIAACCPGCVEVDAAVNAANDSLTVF